MPESQENGLSRGTFIRKVFPAVLGGAAGVLVGKKVSNLIIDSKTSGTGEALEVSGLLTKEQVYLLNEIGDYRKVLGLQGLPAHVEPGRLMEAAVMRWDGEIANTSMEIPAFHQSSADQAMRIQTSLFGKNGGRLVTRIQSDQSVVAAGTFNYVSRTMTLDTQDDPTSEWYNVVKVHEYTHAADPSLMPRTIYPLDTLVNVSHGLARVLSQARSVEGKFLNDPTMYNVPYIKKCIGEGLGRLFLQDKNLEGQIDIAGHSKVIQILAEVAREQKTSLDTLKFTKKACLKLGDALLPEILDHQITISGSLYSDWFAPRMEDASKEFLADMVALALINPDTIQYNQEILAGIEETLTAIHGEPIEINKIIEKLRVADKEVNAIQAQYEAEQQEVTIEERAEQQQQNVFWDFINEGLVPEEIGQNFPVIRTCMMDYGRAVSTVYRQWPEILGGLMADDVDFDPCLHVWETMEIAKAWDCVFFNDLLTDPNLIPENLEEIRRRVAVLDQFIQSPAFQRPDEEAFIPKDTYYPSHAEALSTRLHHLLS